MSFSEKNMLLNLHHGKGDASNLEKKEDPFEVDLRDLLIKEKGFKYIGLFDAEGLALGTGGKEGEEKYVINKAGEKIAGPFHHLRPFSDGLARVRKDDGYYFIDRQGKEVIGPTPRGATVYDFNDGVAVVCDSHQIPIYYCIDKNGNKIPKKQAGEIIQLWENGGKPKSDKSPDKPLSKMREGGLYLVDGEGREIAGPFTRIGHFKEGLALVNVQKKGDDYGENYFVDTKGKKMLGPFHGRRGYDFNEGVAFVLDSKDLNLSYYIDHTGKKVFSPKT